MNRRPTPARTIGIVAVVAFVVVAVLFGFTAVSTEEDAASQQGFDPVTYVDGVWDDIKAAITDNAVPLADVLNRIEPDSQGKARTEDLTPVAQELGLITTGEAHVYRVKATGTVTDVDDRHEPRHDGGRRRRVRRAHQGGGLHRTRLPSDESSIRDAVGFISFGDFKEQTEYGKVAAEINSRRRGLRCGALATGRRPAGQEGDGHRGDDDPHLQPPADRRAQDPRPPAARSRSTEQ